jgi:hypothetical protein
VADYFTPSNQNYLSDVDLDEGSTGVTGIANGQYVVNIGKIGTIFLLNTNSLGGYVPPQSNNPDADYSPNARQVRLARMHALTAPRPPPVEGTKKSYRHACMRADGPQPHPAAPACILCPQGWPQNEVHACMRADDP